jgi:hypothetical protein
MPRVWDGPDAQGRCKVRRRLFTLCSTLPVKRFIIAVLVATFVHAVACIVAPPFEFAPTRPAGFFFAFVSGLMAFPPILALLLFPLRGGLRRFMPGRTQRTHAVAAGLVLVVLVAAMILPRQLAGVPVKPYQHSYLLKWAFWLLLAVAVDVSFFWPFGTPSRSST